MCVYACEMGGGMLGKRGGHICVAVFEHWLDCLNVKVFHGSRSPMIGWNV